jgi:hypothetical protein
LALDTGERSASYPGYFILGNNLRTYRIGAWVGARAGVNVLEEKKYLYLLEIKHIA